MMRRFFFILLFFLPVQVHGLALNTSTTALSLHIVFPLPQENLPDIANVHVLGNVSCPQARVWINNSSVSVYPSGSFAAYVPLQKGNFLITAKAEHGESNVEFNIPVNVGKTSGKGAAQPFKLIEKYAQTNTDGATLAAGPDVGDDRMAYTFFLPEQTRLVLDAQMGQQYRAVLSKTVKAWIDAKDLTFISSWTQHLQKINSLYFEQKKNSSIAVLELAQKIPVTLKIEDDLKTIRLQLLGAVCNLDRVRFKDFATPQSIQNMTWEQISEDTVELTFKTGTCLRGAQVVQDNAELRLIVYFWPDLSKNNKRKPLENLTICLDPGHNPRGGALGPSGTQEAEIVYPIALEAQAQLKQLGARALLSRTTEESLTLPQRVTRSLEQDADIFISIHANSIPIWSNPWTRQGYSVFYYTPQSRRLAELLHQSYKKQTNLADDGFYYSSLAVCRNTAMPSLLLETGYLIRPDEESYLRDPIFIKKIARSLTESIQKYIQETTAH